MKYDFCCIGSALVDITFQIDDDFVLKNEKRGIPKGAMTLIDKEDQMMEITAGTRPTSPVAKAEQQLLS